MGFPHYFSHSLLLAERKCMFLLMGWNPPQKLEPLRAVNVLQYKAVHAHSLSLSVSLFLSYFVSVTCGNLLQTSAARALGAPPVPVPVPVPVPDVSPMFPLLGPRLFHLNPTRGGGACTGSGTGALGDPNVLVCVRGAVP